MSAPAFPADLLAEIRARLPLARVISRHVSLKRSGRSWRGRCPFHTGKTPRPFSVLGDHYRCWSCGERGDLFAWTAWREGVGFIESVRRCAAEAGIDLPKHQHRDDPVRVARLAAERAARLAEYQRQCEAEEAAAIAAAIADAQEIWRECVPLEAALGERHLVETRGIPRPASGWPDCLAWHAALRMLVAAGTTDAGEQQFIHRIYLRADAQNARQPDGSKRKTSRGVMNGAAIRLPGTGDTLHAEGLETGLSAWTATGNPTLVYCGSVADRMQPQPGCNIVLRDDDPTDSPGDKLLIGAMQRWREAGIDFAVAQPWPERRGDKSDFNDTLREAGPEAVAAQIAAARSSTTVLPLAPATAKDDSTGTERKYVSGGFVSSLSGLNGGGGGAGGGGPGGGRGGGDQEPPPGWEENRPLLLLEDLTKPRRPNTTMDALREQMTAGIVAWLDDDESPAHIANTFATGTQKNRITITLLAAKAKAKRKARRDFMIEYRFRNPGASADRVAQAAKEAGHRLLRVACIVPDHGLGKQHADLARSLMMIVAHDAGLERHLDPTDPTTPPLCSQHRRVEQSRQAGEPVRLTACGLDLDGPHCVDRAGCYKWQEIGDCAHAEFVVMVAERATGFHVPYELCDWDYVLIDEPPERVFLPETAIQLDLLDDHLLRSRAPVLHEDGEIDAEGTEEARALYKTLRKALAALNNGYWDREAMTAAGCDADFFTRLVDLTDRRDRSTGMTAATPDDVREDMARNSFRNAVRKICAFGRLDGGVQAGEEGEGRIELAGDAPRIAIMRPRPQLHPGFSGARVMVTGAGLDLDDIRRWLPDAQPMDGCDGIPEAPHQTLVHMHIATGARAMERPQRLRFAKAFVALEADTSRRDATGVLTLKAYEGLFNGMPGIISGHHGAVVGRNPWMNTTTFINFASRFLKPRDAAALGAADTGEKVPIKPPVRQHRRVALRGGGDVALPIMDYEHPAAAAANRRVRDFDILQGPLARPRASDRTADNPVITFNIGTAVPDGCECDVVITGWQDYAPEKMVTAFAERGHITQHSLGRHVLHPDIYTKPWTGQNDQRLETDGFKATALRMVVPPWRDGPNEPCVIGRLWRSGHAHREAGEMFFSTVRAFPQFKAEAIAKYGATRIKVDQKLWPYRPLTETEAELTINVEREDTGEFIDSSRNDLPGMTPGGASTSWRVEHPPDG